MSVALCDWHKTWRDAIEWHNILYQRNDWEHFEIDSYFSISPNGIRPIGQNGSICRNLMMHIRDTFSRHLNRLISFTCNYCTAQNTSIEMAKGNYDAFYSLSQCRLPMNSDFQHTLSLSFWMTHGICRQPYMQHVYLHFNLFSCEIRLFAFINCAFFAKAYNAAGSSFVWYMDGKIFEHVFLVKLKTFAMKMNLNDSAGD